MREFEKLDAFMRDNAPLVKPKMRKVAFEQKKSIFWGLAVSGILATVVMFVNTNQRTQGLEDMAELVEVMTWDATEDEIPEEVSEMMEMSD